MARLNVKPKSTEVTHEGAPAVSGLKPLQQLRRSVLSCLLWESEFYEDGHSIADRIRATAKECAPEDVAALAIEARSTYNLRHAPLLLLDVLTRTGAGKPGLVAKAIEQTIQRADELSEFCAIYMHDKRKPLSGQAKKGLAAAFHKFDEYALAKYNRDGKFKLRDVLFLCHAKPKDDTQKALWERLIDGKLAIPDTWEVALSTGKDKKETWERLIKEQKLGYLAVLRNLRNMIQANADEEIIRAAILARKGAKRVLPFRYVAAARAAPQFEPEIDKALCAAIAEMAPLPGKTIALVDVSGSMDAPLSTKSDLQRVDAAAALAAIVPGNSRMFSFSNALIEVPPRKGMAGVDAIKSSQPHQGTWLGKAVAHLNTQPHDRLIVITDEQSHDPVPPPVAKKAYMINVASAQNGVGYRNGWTHIDGFSEAVLKYIGAIESSD